jgi:truncated hemoglobin YjbI
MAPQDRMKIGNRERARDLSADAIIRLRESLNLLEEQVERIKEATGGGSGSQRLEAREMRDRLCDEEITREEFREELQSRRSIAIDGG